MNWQRIPFFHRAYNHGFVAGNVLGFESGLRAARASRGTELRVVIGGKTMLLKDVQSYYEVEPGSTEDPFTVAAEEERKIAALALLDQVYAKAGQL